MKTPASREYDKEEFEARLELTKAFGDTAKSYIQISSAALALPLLFTQAVLGKDIADHGLGSNSWSLVTAWLCFLMSIAFGLTYQWFSVRRLWDDFHEANWTPEKSSRPGYRKTWWVISFSKFNLAWLWFGMAGSFYLGSILFTWFAYELISKKILPNH
jgi:hypothetical protein